MVSEGTAGLDALDFIEKALIEGWLLDGIPLVLDLDGNNNNDYDVQSGLDG